MNCRGILLDIEGTTSSIAFVHQEMFPYVRREMAGFLERQGQRPDVVDACQQVMLEANPAGPADGGQGATLSARCDRDSIVRAVFQLMDADAKRIGLKLLQGLVWEEGFRSGALRGHVYEDVPAALTRWQAAGLDVRIYSSGSVAAQRLFFQHTVAGNLLPFLNGHFDTATGPKREPASYATIAKEFAVAPATILFASDVAEELDAARSSGMRTVLLLRPGNEPVTATAQHPACFSLEVLPQLLFAGT